MELRRGLVCVQRRSKKLWALSSNAPPAISTYIQYSILNCVCAPIYMGPCRSVTLYLTVRHPCVCLWVAERGGGGDGMVLLFCTRQASSIGRSLAPGQRLNKVMRF